MDELSRGALGARLLALERQSAQLREAKTFTL